MDLTFLIELDAGPKVDGLHDFAGTLLHTSNWDPSKLNFRPT